MPSNGYSFVKTKIIAGDNISISSTGSESGTGNVTINSINSTNSFNRIINGQMIVDQYRNGSSVLASTASSFVCDKWNFLTLNLNRWTIQQNLSGFSESIKSSKISITSTYSSAANESTVFQQKIEGVNCGDLNFGTSYADSIVVSFWAKSSLTGLFNFNLSNAGTRFYYKQFSISAANQWQFFSFVIPGDTIGTWAADNTVGLRLQFFLAGGANFNTSTTDTWVGSSNGGFKSGSANLSGTAGSYLELTNISLMKGNDPLTSTSIFPFYSYQNELILCRREFIPQMRVYLSGPGVLSLAAQVGNSFNFDPMRATPTATLLINSNSGNISGTNNVNILDNSSGTCTSTTGILGAAWIMHQTFSLSATL